MNEQNATPASTNIAWHHATVNRERREKLNGHKSMVLWFTSLSGAGKSTLAHAVEEQLHQLGCRTFILDGDNVRHGLSSNLGFTEADRKENIRRIGEAARLMMEAGVITLTASLHQPVSGRPRSCSQAAAVWRLSRNLLQGQSGDLRSARCQGPVQRHVPAR